MEPVGARRACSHTLVTPFGRRPRYIRERDLDWAYWPLDGQQGPSRQRGAVEGYGLLNATWDGWAYPPLLAELQALMM